MSVRDVEDVLQFWLAEVGPERWYENDGGLDTQIKERFESLWTRASSGDCDHWLLTPRGALALIIVLDQFPRNMFRGTASAYRSDSKALCVAKQAIRRGHDKVTPEPERQFFYLPLMHSEALTDQERCVRLIKLTLPATGDENLEHARRHREVIRRFGRFPSRNGPLGRNDTEAERQYRDAGGYMA
ncbi:MAG: DUF924 domain-containing protein [Paracoccaceae bacterium]|nr:DUF924 domain-containing protein [Paracoccaceae bacterium]